MSKKSKRFVQVERGSTGLAETWEVLVDRQTRVQYLFRAWGQGGGLTVLLGQDGRPLLYLGPLEEE